MEDDTPPESLLPYDVWMEESLRQVVLKALDNTAQHGLPGGHHFYITFRTDYPGVEMPARLREKYKQEMTIVLQHQYDKLWVDGPAGCFGVTLSFGGIASALVIPVGAVSAFVDPSIQYGLRFNVAMPDAPEPVKPAAQAVPDAGSGAAAEAAVDSTPQVVSLDAFRKRKD